MCAVGFLLLAAYAAGRDVMRMRNADWHAKYTLPSLMAFYEPNRENHGSYRRVPIGITRIRARRGRQDIPI